MCFGPASPDAGVELLRQLFLQCTLITRNELQKFMRMVRNTLVMRNELQKFMRIVRNS